MSSVVRKLSGISVPSVPRLYSPADRATWPSCAIAVGDTPLKAPQKPNKRLSRTHAINVVAHLCSVPGAARLVWTLGIKRRYPFPCPATLTQISSYIAWRFVFHPSQYRCTPARIRLPPKRRLLPHAARDKVGSSDPQHAPNKSLKSEPRHGPVGHIGPVASGAALV